MKARRLTCLAPVRARLLHLTCGLLAIALGAATAQSQGTGRITGVVTAANGQPLPGAQVAVTGTTRGAAADAEGRFTILAVPAGTATLRASMLGFAPVTRSVAVTADGATTSNFQLVRQAVQLEALVAIGYGTQRLKDVTGSVGSVDAEELERTQVPSIVQALQGRAAGVAVNQSSSAPGGGASIRVRGSGTITSGGEPLYVIDGVPLYSNNGEDDASSGAPGSVPRRVSGNTLSFLNTNDIESIQVLKDASSTAIYGARGANGVILVTTKRGRSGLSEVNVESSFGTQKVTKKLDVLDATQHAEFINEWSTATRGSPIYANPSSQGIGTDWQELIFRSAPTMEQNINVRGGNGGTKFLISGNATGQDGIIRSTSFDRYTVRANIDHELSSKINIGSNITAARLRFDHGLASEGGLRTEGSAVSGALATYPALGVSDSLGNYTRNDLTPPPGLLGIVTGRNHENPIAALNEVSDDNRQDRVLGNAFVEYNFLPGVQLRLNGGVNLSSGSRAEYYTRKTQQGLAGGRAVTGNVGISNYLMESVLRMNRTFGVHALDVTAGATREQQDEDRRTILTGNFITDITRENDLAAGTPAGGPTVTSFREEWTLLSFIGRANYTLRDRYMMTLTGRRDGSSKFGENNKWGFFPSVALAWRLSEEPFLKGGFFEDLKLRASFGQTGNQEIPVYRSLARLASAGYPIGGTANVGGYAPNRVANPDLKWERSAQWDAGVDATVLGGRLTFSADLYRKVTDDLLLDAPLPRESGFGSALVNIGKVENRGLELSLGGDVVDRGSFLWRTNANFSANRNKVLDAGATTNFTSGTQLSSNIQINGLRVEEGRPIGIFYGYNSSGIFQSAAEAAAHCTGTPCVPIQPGAIPGQLRIVDANGDGRITPADRMELGNADPDFTLGWSNDVRFRGLGLYVFMQGAFGQEVYNVNNEEIAGIQADPGVNLISERWLDRWTPTNPSAKWPIVALPRNQGYRGIGSNEVDNLYVEDGSFLRLRNVTLTFDVPQRLLRELPVSARSAQLFVSGENLHTWTKYSGYDPDVNSAGGGNINRGIDLAAYPLARAYKLGFRLGL